MLQTDQDKPKILSENLFPVVGIGASAGGLDAFKKFIKNIPGDSGMAYIIVQHLHPGHDSAKYFPGIGIGLTICHDIIEKHMGKIWAVSEVDKGSSFYFTLPILENGEHDTGL